MLCGINPLLTGVLLAALDEMGHSDTVVIADANFPAHRVGRTVVEVPGIDIVAMAEAVVSVLPLDEDNSPILMESNLVPRPRVQDEIVAATGADQHRLVDRYEYYDLASQANLVISTGELRLWANVILAKGLPHYVNS